jgi:hypothetical protein
MVSLVTNTGLANVIAAWHAYASRVRYLQWGEGSGQDATDNSIAAAGDTTENRTAGTSSQETVTTTGDTYQVVGSIVAAGARAITELGVYDAAGSGNPPTGGNMGIYGDFSVVNLDTNDSIAFTVRATADQA